MAKKNLTVKIFAGFALFGIVLSIIGTGVIMIFGGSNSHQEQIEITPEQLQQMIEFSSTGETSTGTENLIEEIISTGSVEVSTGEITE